MASMLALRSTKACISPLTSLSREGVKRVVPAGRWARRP
jgi:hypothetical protein